MSPVSSRSPALRRRWALLLAVGAAALALLRSSVAFVGSARCQAARPRRQSAASGGPWDRAGVLSPLRAALSDHGDPGSWVVPTVDKDTSEFHSGSGKNYAFVQTSETLFLFTPYPGNEPGKASQVQLEIVDDGTHVRLNVEGSQVLDGILAHKVKPATEIWMIEEAADGRQFVVVEADKAVPGIEWSSVFAPQVTISDRYSNRPRVELPAVNDAEVQSAIEETLDHLRRKHARLTTAPAEQGAVAGDILTVDMQAFEALPDGGKGAKMNIGASKDMRVELGAAGQAGGALPPDVHQQLMGIKLDEIRDVKVTLGRRGGDLGGRTIICAITCKRHQHQSWPDLDDEFAKTVKRSEQMVQAGTLEGVPEEEMGMAATFTLAQLRGEIQKEIDSSAADHQRQLLHRQLEADLLDTVAVECEWARPRADLRSSQEHFEHEEKLAAVLHKVAESEGRLANIDPERVEKEAWDLLGEPKKGENIAEVGKDPAREFQEARRKVHRQHIQKEVLEWIESRTEVVAAEPAAA